MASGEMKEENLETMCVNMDILIAGLDVCHMFELKGNLAKTAYIRSYFLKFDQKQITRNLRNRKTQKGEK